MPVDNEIYNQPGDIWWDEDQPLNVIRTALNPAQLRYFTQTFDALGLDPAGKLAVDVGCGGGLMAEEIARLASRRHRGRSVRELPVHRPRPRQGRRPQHRLPGRNR